MVGWAVGAILRSAEETKRLGGWSGAGGLCRWKM